MQPILRHLREVVHEAAPEAEETMPFRKTLKEKPAAEAAFGRFSPSQRREYLEWIAETKREGIRRIATAIEWSAEDKARN